MKALRVTRVLAAATLVMGGSLLAAAPASAQVYNPDAPPVASISQTIVVAGQNVTVNAFNFNIGEIVVGTVFSTPRNIGTAVADGAGAVSFTFSTAGLEAGPHHVDLVGSAGNIARVEFTVVAPGQGSGIPGGNGTGTGNGSGNGAGGTGGGSGTGTGSNGSGSGLNGSGSGSTGTGSTGSASSYNASSIDTGVPGEGTGPDGTVLAGGIALVAVAGAGAGVMVLRRRNAA
ncbi:hypothetical protein [Rhodococcus sp. X156]|uniref:hypothetical protein n=1 Tax=Rhodococcus sp. X156 TaxID=2499145 RepID=UPI000FD9CCCC|nr:hypothetical protein [Rhodococcus sp. X156]